MREVSNIWCLPRGIESKFVQCLHKFLVHTNFELLKILNMQTPQRERKDYEMRKMIFIYYRRLLGVGVVSAKESTRFRLAR